MPVTEDVLNVLIDVEGTLHQFATPDPDESGNVKSHLAAGTTYPLSDTDVADWTNQQKQATSGTQLSGVATLLEKMYEVSFLKTAGEAVGNVVNGASEILIEIADRLEDMASLGLDAAPTLTDILDALRKIPGSDEELDKAAEILEIVVNLLDDVPSASAELYMIAQQIRLVSKVFSSPSSY